MLVCVVENGSRTRIARITGHIVGYHEDNLAIGDAQPFHATVDREDVCDMPVVEPEAGRVHQDRPVVRVAFIRELEVQLQGFAGEKIRLCFGSH